MMKNLKTHTAQEIYDDLQIITAELGSNVPCMISAIALHQKLQPGEWETIKKDLSVKNMKEELTKLKEVDNGK